MKKIRNIKSSSRHEETRPITTWIQAFCLCLVLIITSAVTPQEETDDELEDEDDEIEMVVVTGSRLAQNLGEVAGQVIVFDEEDILATGEVTLERVLRQLPENLNPTTERYGSDLNNVANFTASSTVNLRGLGSESTLILVDGKRIGYNGILGGVTDVSSIPLSQVERIEIVLDGASAIYGSDAVGGVVNIITKKDFEGVELVLNLDTPIEGGFNETRMGISTSQLFSDIMFRGSYQRSVHTGLDASDREVTLFQQSIFPGPMYDVRFCCLSDGSSLPIAYGLNGDVLTVPEYNALSDADKAAATVYTHAILPDGFNSNSTVDDITNFSMPAWGADTQEGYTILPDITRDHFAIGATYDATETLSIQAQVRGENRTVLNNRGYITFTGESLHRNNPFNPFGQTVHLRGQRRDFPQPFDETTGENLDLSVDVQGVLSDRIGFEVSLGQTTSDAETLRYNNLDRNNLRAGMASDGVSPVVEYLTGLSAEDCAAMGGQLSFGRCRVFRDPIPSVDPFGDISQFISDTPLRATSFNRQFRFEGSLRAELFEVPAGIVRVLFGASNYTTELNSSADFQVGAVDQSPISDIRQFDTEAQRSNSAFFAEGVIPLVSEANSHSLMDSLMASFSLRSDSYQEPEVTYVDPVDGASSPEGLPDPGSETTGGFGLVWKPDPTFRVAYNFQTAFVAPQLNQLLRATSRGPSPAFRGIWLQQPDGSLRTVQVTIIEGGNPDLLSETADTQSFGVSFTPVGMNASASVTLNNVEYMNRINRLSNFIVDPQNLPSDITYIEESDEYIQERRWINVSSVDRAGIDYEFEWNPSSDHGDFHFKVRHSTISTFEYVIDPDDPENDETISVVGTSEGSTAVGVVSENSTNFNFGWATNGFDTILDISTRSKTTRVFTGVNREYTPPLLADLTVSYNIASDGFFKLPEVLHGGRIVVVINNLFDEYGSTKITNDSGELLQQQGPDASPLYGRVLNLSIHLPL